MQEYLVISAIGEDRPGIINSLSQAATDSQCNILDTRMAVLGGEFALIMLVNGQADDVARAESALPAAAQEFGLTTIMKRTQLRPSINPSCPYRVTVISLDHPGIVKEIAGFFSKENINIETMETATYAAAHTGSPMFSLEMSVNIPGSANIATLKESFICFCDERNLDATMEPCR